MRTLSRLTWILLGLGVLLRSVAINQPLIDAHLFRQTQTADAVRSQLAAPRWELSAHASWLGDSGARLVQELPVYNFLVVAVHAIVGNLDMSGKIVSVALWAAAFLCLQSIWRRVLTPSQADWANLLFVLSPLSIFFGQAFMPEMLIRLCEFAFLAALLAYLESGRLAVFLIAAVAGAIGMLVKTPEFSHLYIAAGLIVFQREGWSAIRRPRYWVALIATAASLKAWAGFVDATNAPSFPEWAASAAARGFIGSWRDRFALHPYVKYAGYLTAFACTPVGLLITAFGGVRVVRQFRQHPVLVAWGVSLVAFYLFWGPRTAGEHSYYHLPALGLACALFGIGASRCCELAGRWRNLRWSRLTATAIVIGVAATSAAATAYLFRQDRPLYAAAIWVKQNVPKGEWVLFRMNHRSEMDYGQAPTMSYYAGRDAWVYSRSMREDLKTRALRLSTWAVVIRQPSGEGFTGRLRRLLRGGEAPFIPEDMSWLENDAGFVRFTETPEFTIFKKPSLPDRGA